MAEDKKNIFEALDLGAGQQARVEQALPDAEWFALRIFQSMDEYFHEYGGEKSEIFLGGVTVLLQMLHRAGVLTPEREVNECEVTLIYGFLATSMLLVDTVHNRTALERQVEALGHVPVTKVEDESLKALAEELKDLGNDHGEDG